MPLASTPTAYNLLVVPNVPNDDAELRFGLTVYVAPFAVVGETVKPVPTATFVTVPVLEVFAFHALILASVTRRCVVS